MASQELGTLIQEALREFGKSVADVAHWAGVTTPYLYNLMSGRGPEQPSVPYLRAMADAIYGPWKNEPERFELRARFLRAAGYGDDIVGPAALDTLCAEQLRQDRPSSHPRVEQDPRVIKLAQLDGDASKMVDWLIDRLARTG